MPPSTQKRRCNEGWGISFRKDYVDPRIYIPTHINGYSVKPSDTKGDPYQREYCSILSEAPSPPIPTKYLDTLQTDLGLFSQPIVL